MESFEIIHYLHIVAFAVIVGIEVPSVYAVRLSLRTSTPPAARAVAIQVRRWTYAIGGLMLVTFLPFGTSIAIDIGVYTLMSPAWLTATWIVALVWFGFVLAAELTGASIFARRLYTTEIVLRFLIGLGHVYDGIVGFLGTGMILTNWLAAKVVLFGLVLIVSSLIRWQTRTIRFADGATLEDDAAAGQLARAQWGSYLIVAMALVAAWMGTVKPW
ncbi:MAG: hypothetical protein GKS03_09150 [Alphaproteobacteria bacterium]|nr:hypothetical protein [Alphaproteobacteria bacterium]